MNVNPVGFALYEERLWEYQNHINGLYGLCQFKPEMVKVARSKKVKERMVKAEFETKKENAKETENREGEQNPGKTDEAEVKETSARKEPLGRQVENTTPQDSVADSEEPSLGIE